MSSKLLVCNHNFLFNGTIVVFHEGNTATFRTQDSRWTELKIMEQEVIFASWSVWILKQNETYIFTPWYLDMNIIHMEEIAWCIEHWLRVHVIFWRALPTLLSYYHWSSNVAESSKGDSSVLLSQVNQDGSKHDKSYEFQQASNHCYISFVVKWIIWSKADKASYNSTDGSFGRIFECWEGISILRLNINCSKNKTLQHSQYNQLTSK